MRKIIIIIFIVGFCFNQSTAFSATNDFEKFLIVGDGVSADNELSILYKNRAINSDEVTSLGAFIVIEIMQNIASFDILYNKYLISKDKNDYKNIEITYNKIINITNYNKRVISQAVNYLSDDFISKYNNKLDEINKQMPHVTEIYNDEIHKEIDNKRKQELVNKLKKEELEKREIIERKRQEEAEKIYIAANTWAENNIEYTKPEIICEICEAVKSKNEYEKYIRKEKQYASKYGVINLSLIEEFKVGIIRCDNLIKEKSAEYKKLTNNKFNFSSCSIANLSCSDELDNIKEKLVERYLADHHAE